MSTKRTFKDKLIAFIDILGFKSKVHAAERGSETDLENLLDQCSKLGQAAHAKEILQYGPTICPQSRCVERTLDYVVTQISDSAVISAEVSPAGVVNLLHHVSKAMFGLLREGSMVRGYVCRGSIYHVKDQFLGTGYQNAVEQEKEVRAFLLLKDDSATPFVEIAPAVVEYVKNETDQCVREMFERMTTSDASGITVIHPIKRLSAMAASGFDLEQCERNLGVVADWVSRFLIELESQSPKCNPTANAKAKYYRKFLNEELENCSRLQSEFRSLREPATMSRHGPL